MAEEFSLEEALAAGETDILEINSDLRTINVPSGYIFGVFNDKDVLPVLFKMNKTYDTLDMSTFQIRINFMNAADQTSSYIVTDKKVDGDTIYFSWLLGREVFVGEGTVKFVVCLRRFNPDGTVEKEFNTTIARSTVLNGLEVDDPESDPYKIIGQIDSIEILLQCQEIQEDVNTKAEDVNDLYEKIKLAEINYGAPFAAATASEMTNRSRVYVYTGSESGYNNGHWYYYNGTAWTDGGTYQSTGIQTDKTLTVPDMAADAKTVGDEITGLKADLSDLNDAVFTSEEKNIEWVQDLVIKGDGYIRANNPTKVSKPVLLKSGETIKVTTKGDGNSWFSCIASVPSVDTPIYEYSVIATVLKTITVNTLTEYTYTASNDMFIICCVLDDVTSKIEFENLEKISIIDEIEADIANIEKAHQIQYRYVPVSLDFTSYPNKRFGVSNGKIVITDEPASNNFCICKLEVSEGEKYKICGLKYYQARCFAVVDDSDNVLTVDSGSGNVYNVVQSITIPTNGVYMYVSGYFLQNVQKYVISNDISILTNKKIAYNGDSICATVLNNNTNRMNGGGYAKVISDITGCEFWNTAVDGSILRQKEGSGTNYHSVSDSIVDMPTDADIYCFEGGINDYWTNAVLGTYSPTDYTTTLDKTTVCGALEYIFRYCIENFVGKAICFVIVHKVGNTSFNANSQGNTFKDYHDSFVGLCEKYGIPYYDAWLHSGLNGWNSTQSSAYLTANPEGTGDGTHPNRAGYERYYVPQLMRLFESIVKR